MDVERGRLEQHVRALAALPRPAETAELAVARQYAAHHLLAAGWQVREQGFYAAGEALSPLCGVNLHAEHPDHPLATQPRLIIGAHLDTRPDSPGADDNASGVAALLELARVLAATWPARAPLALELVVYDLEELGMLGAAAHVEQCRQAAVDVRGMVALEMLGYCDRRPNSQQLPRSLVGLYPTTGDFIAAIGNQNSPALLDAFAAGLRTAPGLGVETLSVPDNGNWLQATRLSDHSPFWDAGYAALMLTDTSFLRNPHYHTAGDTPETLDFEFLTQVARGVVAAVRQILENGL